MKVRYSYLEEQFRECEDLWSRLKEFVATGDFTLGAELSKFEDNFADLIGSKYAVGVNSGTDAIKLSLKALGVSHGDEVITAANTYVATVGAIAELGAVPVFVDCDDSFCMNTENIERVITEKTKAIVPVHFTGYMTDMDKLTKLADQNELGIVEDACQSILGSQLGKNAGTWGTTGAFSLHPLKNLNVWSDGGVITTDDQKILAKLRLLRNHGLADRDSVEILGYNSRLDTIQAVVGNWLIPSARDIMEKRVKNAHYYDKHLSLIPQVQVPVRPLDYQIVFHLYIVLVKERDALLRHCIERGIEAKIHYPTPIYRQPALMFLGHKKGDFPVADAQAETCISFPCDQHLTEDQMKYVVETVSEFYRAGS